MANTKRVLTNNEQVTKDLLEFDLVETFEQQFTEGLLRVSQKKKFGAYQIEDQDGKLVIDVRYDSVNRIPYSDTLFSVCIDKQYGVVNVENLAVGRIIVPVEFDRVEGVLRNCYHQEGVVVMEDIFRVVIKAKHGIFSVEDQRAIVPIEFDRVDMLTPTLFLVKKGRRWGMFSTESKEATWKS